MEVKGTDALSARLGEEAPLRRRSALTLRVKHRLLPTSRMSILGTAANEPDSYPVAFLPMG